MYGNVLRFNQYGNMQSSFYNFNDYVSDVKFDIPSMYAKSLDL